MADLIDRLGGIPPARIRLHPFPGTATVQDLVHVEAREKGRFELVDGTLVEKAMGYRESALAGVILALLRAFVVPRNLGIVTGEAGMVQIFRGLVRMPDVAYVSWDRVPGRAMPADPVPSLAPDLAVEVLSAGNTPAEMRRKRQEYFRAGVRLVWEVEPNDRTVAVYTAPEGPTVLTAGQNLDGGVVLQGFTLALNDVFAELDRNGNR